jgi:5'-methylthioadenosine phosphorylase
MAKLIGVLGGSGLYSMEGLTDLREERVSTPFGDPSDALVFGRLGDAELVFLPRHGRGHRLNPSEVPYRANIFAMKSVGVDWLIAVSAVGSLREEIVPGHVVCIDQFIDRTKSRPATFYEGGVVAHIPFGQPLCPTLRGFLLDACEEAGAICHDGGTYVCMEGPAFSTRAESELYRSWGASVVGMTNLTEAKLAREAEISFATLAMATDYDCWHTGHDDVTVDQVIAVVRQNVALAQRVVQAATRSIMAFDGPAPMSSALQNSIMTASESIPDDLKEALGPLIGKYV